MASYIKERTKNAQFIVISLRNNMFELASRLVGVYKVNHMVNPDPPGLSEWKLTFKRLKVSRSKIETILLGERRKVLGIWRLGTGRSKLLPGWRRATNEQSSATAFGIGESCDTCRIFICTAACRTYNIAVVCQV